MTDFVNKIINLKRDQFKNHLFVKNFNFQLLVIVATSLCCFSHVSLIIEHKEFTHT